MDSSLYLLCLCWEFLFSMCFKHICNWLSKHFTMAALKFLLDNLHMLYIDCFFSSWLWFSWFLVLEAILDWNLEIWKIILCDWLYDSRLFLALLQRETVISSSYYHTDVEVHVPHLASICNPEKWICSLLLSACGFSVSSLGPCWYHTGWQVYGGLVFAFHVAFYYPGGVGGDSGLFSWVVIKVQTLHEFSDSTPACRGNGHLVINRWG